MKRRSIILCLILLLLLTGCGSRESPETGIAAPAAQWENTLYVTDPLTRSVYQYDLQTGEKQVLLEGAVDNLLVDWPRMWLVEGSRRLLCYDFENGKKEEVYRSEQGLDGLLFRYGDGIYFEEWQEEQNADCLRLDPASGEISTFLADSNIYHRYDLAFAGDRLYYTCGFGPAYSVSMEEDEEPRLEDQDHWFTLAAFGGNLYYSKYTGDHPMVTLNIADQTPLTLEDGCDAIQLWGANENTLFLRVGRRRDYRLLAYDGEHDSTVLEDWRKYQLSDTNSEFYFLNRGLVFWCNSDVLAPKATQSDSHYLFLYDLKEQQFRQLDCLANRA